MARQSSILSSGQVRTLVSGNPWQKKTNLDKLSQLSGFVDCFGSGDFSILVIDFKPGKGHQHQSSLSYFYKGLHIDSSVGTDMLEKSVTELTLDGNAAIMCSVALWSSSLHCRFKQ
ncbi:hypothetical protein NE237_030842 [Protea cynaroides]|uniref:Uncharacterized protein n=1 Tax=Protea cynaroides TaxID=273540 RepID=A0A9Q0GWX9_9MAGN|nr:hypothetical protein NE237_030842 [Protea cynaroides]